MGGVATISRTLKPLLLLFHDGLELDKTTPVVPKACLQNIYTEN